MYSTRAFVVRPLKLVAAVAATWACVNASAQTLSELVTSAKAYDAQVLTAQMNLDAATASAEQSMSSLYPQVGLGGGASYTKPIKNDSTKALSIGVSATHALYNKGNEVTRNQAQLGIESARISLLQAEQTLMANISQAYFDLLSAKAQLTVISASKKAAKEQLARAKRNFEVGTSTITDTHEAQAQFDRIVASEIAAQNDERVKQLSLDQLVGKDQVQTHDLRPDVELPDMASQSVDTWVQQGLINNPQLKLAKIGLRASDFAIEKAKASQSPTVDLTYKLTVPKVVDFECRANMFSGASSACTNHSVGVNLSMPLFTGYAIENGIKAAVAKKASTEAEINGAKRGITQGIREAYFGLLSGTSQIKALQAAVASSQSALEANKTGYDVGVRINADVLNAQSQLYQTEVALTTTRYQLLNGGIKLRQAAGTLSEQDLVAIDRLLVR